MEQEGAFRAKVLISFFFFFSGDELAFWYKAGVFISKEYHTSILVTCITIHVFKFPAWCYACRDSFDLIRQSTW